MPKFTCPFGKGWAYVTVTMRCMGGVQVQHRLWRNTKTKELRWETL